MHSIQKLQSDFKRLIDRGRLSHAYLLFGNGIRSKEAGSAFAASLAGFLELKTWDAETASLVEFLKIEPDEKKSIGIDSVRRIADFLCVKPAVSTHRTVFIEGGEFLTPEAQNAILKIVEEPPEWGLIIISVLNIENLSPTLSSRFQKIFIPAAPASRLRPAADGQTRGSAASLEEILAMKIIDEESVDAFLEDTLEKLDKDPIKNVNLLKTALSRLSVIKSFNVNVRLQLRVLRNILN